MNTNTPIRFVQAALVALVVAPLSACAVDAEPEHVEDLSQAATARPSADPTYEAEVAGAGGGATSPGAAGSFSAGDPDGSRAAECTTTCTTTGTTRCCTTLCHYTAIDEWGVSGGCFKVRQPGGA
jgi:hypothetical protein